MPTIRIDDDPGNYTFEVLLDNESESFQFVMNIFEFGYALNAAGVSDPEDATIEQVVAAAKQVGRPKSVVEKMSDAMIFAKASAAGMHFQKSGNVPEPSPM